MFENLHPFLTSSNESTHLMNYKYLFFVILVLLIEQSLSYCANQGSFTRFNNSNGEYPGVLGSFNDKFISFDAMSSSDKYGT